MALAQKILEIVRGQPGITDKRLAAEQTQIAASESSRGL
jgi:hypothetical protein